MVSYNFPEGFARDIITGRKAAMLKPFGKRPHVEAGGMVHAFCGNLPPDFTKSERCHRLLTAPCTRSVRCRMAESGLTVDGQLVVNPEWLRTIAAQEGFDSFADLNTHFHRTYGLPWDGQYIRWNHAAAEYVAEWPLVQKPPGEAA